MQGVTGGVIASGHTLSSWQCSYEPAMCTTRIFKFMASLSHVHSKPTASLSQVHSKSVASPWQVCRKSMASLSHVHGKSVACPQQVCRMMKILIYAQSVTPNFTFALQDWQQKAVFAGASRGTVHSFRRGEQGHCSYRFDIYWCHLALSNTNLTLIIYYRMFFHSFNCIQFC